MFEWEGYGVSVKPRLCVIQVQIRRAELEKWANSNNYKELIQCYLF